MKTKHSRDFPPLSGVPFPFSAERTDLAIQFCASLFLGTHSLYFACLHTAELTLFDKNRYSIPILSMFVSDHQTTLYDITTFLGLHATHVH